MQERWTPIGWPRWGASYGGYLTAWAVATGELFRGGIVITGISKLHSCRGTANNGPFYEFLCLGAPRDQRGRIVDFLAELLSGRPELLG